MQEDLNIMKDKIERLDQVCYCGYSPLVFHASCKVLIWIFRIHLFFYRKALDTEKKYSSYLAQCAKEKDEVSNKQPVKLRKYMN